MKNFFNIQNNPYQVNLTCSAATSFTFTPTITKYNVSDFRYVIDNNDVLADLDSFGWTNGTLNISGTNGIPDAELPPEE